MVLAIEKQGAQRITLSSKASALFRVLHCLVILVGVWSPVQASQNKFFAKGQESCKTLQTENLIDVKILLLKNSLIFIDKKYTYG